MCELLGMSANVPTDICFSLQGLIARGGRTGPHSDGWGIAFYEDRGCRVFHDPLPGANSPVAQFVRDYPIKSCNVISHVRQANRGRIALENTHPFTRELWGRVWTFAHNGQLAGVKKLPLGRFRPVGTTDSEHAFCWLLEQMHQRWQRLPSALTLARFLKTCFKQLHGMGICNVLMSEGRALYTHCSTKLCWITRRAPFGEAKLLDEEVCINFTEHTTPNDVVTVIATQPLTNNEAWTLMQAGDCIVFREGEARAV